TKKNAYKINEKVMEFFSNEKYSNIFNRVFDFSTRSIKLKIKNLSKTIRSVYFSYEIKNLQQIIDYKTKHENPLYSITITNEDIFTQSLILSENKSLF